MNTNCLEGLQCPKCKQEDELLVQVREWVSLSDDGTDPYADSVDNMGGPEWEDTSPTICPECKFTGPMKKFKKKNPKGVK